MRLAIVACLAARVVFAQSFDVASVKPAHPPDGTGRFTMNGGPGTSDPGRLSYTNIPLKRVLLSAFDVKQWQVSGPDWLNTERFDIVANVPEGATKEQCQAMLRNLLLERFRMKVHRETRVEPIYALVVGKDGVKLNPPEAHVADAAPEELAVVKRQEGKDGFPTLSLAAGVVIETKGGRARVTCRKTSLAKFAEFLAGRLGRPVVDVTTVAGEFDFDLYFAADGVAAEGVTDPDLFGAVQQQLGLKLEARKGPVEFLVIDHVESTPTQN
jgi:uncharacterized protein (TIGR03435 family)